MPPKAADTPHFGMVAFVTLLFLLNYMDRAIFGPLLPVFELEFGLDHATATRLLLFTSVGYSVSFLASTFTAPMFRPKQLVCLSLFACGAVMLCIATAQSALWAGLMFVALGMAAGQYFASAMATVRSLVDAGNWGKALAVHELGPTVSFILAPLAARWGSLYLGWRGVVAVMGGLSMAAAICYLVFGKGGSKKPPPVSLASIGGALRSRPLMLFTYLMVVAIAGEFAPYSILTLHLTEDRHLSPDAAAAILSSSRLLSPFAVLLGGWLTQFFGLVRTLFIFLSLYALGMILMALPSHGMLLTGLFLQPVATAMLFPPVFLTLSEFFADSEMPMLISISTPVASFAGMGIMPSILGLLGKYLSFNAGFVLMAAMALAAIPLIIATRKKTSGKASA